MPYNVLLLPLLGGFLFITFWDRTRWHARRAEKDRLLIFAALAGLLFLGLAYLIRSIPPFLPCVSFCPYNLGLCVNLPCPPEWWDRNIGFPQSGVATFAFILGALGWWPLNRLSDRYYKEWASDGKRGSERREFVRVVDHYGGPLEQLFLRSMQEETAVMITLKGGKVYIGDIGASFIPGLHTHFLLLPSRSGYRDRKQRLELTTDYDDVYEKVRADENENESTRIIGSFGVAIPVDEVVAASLYLPDIHKKYFPHRILENEPLEMD
jgi:hypothetical protein